MATIEHEVAAAKDQFHRSLSGPPESWNENGNVAEHGNGRVGVYYAGTLTPDEARDYAYDVLAAAEIAAATPVLPTAIMQPPVVREGDGNDAS